jgi:subtilisin family serine protease
MSEGDDIIEVKWNSEAWERAILERTDLGRFGDRGDLVLFTPRTLLVDSGAAQDDGVQRQLLRRNARRSDQLAAQTAESLGLTLFTIPDDQLLDAVQDIRRLVPGSASLDHVWLPGPNSVHGDDLPAPSENPGDIPGASSAGTALAIHVLDTGIAPDVPFAVESGPADAEVPDEDEDDNRDHAAGHGTHVAGIVARTAPAARIVARRLMKTPVGMASELETARALAEAGRKGANIINCSFGGHTLFDAPPLATERALAQLPRGTVVVASAGNSGTERPNWPAASKRVVAVGSVARDERSGEWKQTDFSNHGYWVDCCAPGVAIDSTFLHWDGGDDEPVFDGFAAWTGTSFSSPAVAAAIARYATDNGVEPSLAAWHVVHDPSLPRIGTVGTLVDP